MKTKTLTKETNLQKMKRTIKHSLQTITCMAIAFYYQVVNAKADLTNPEKITISSDANADEIFGKTIGLIFEITKYAGAILFIMGIVKLLMAIHNDQGDQIKSSVMMAGIGLVLACLKAVCQALGIIG